MEVQSAGSNHLQMAWIDRSCWMPLQQWEYGGCLPCRKWRAAEGSSPFEGGTVVLTETYHASNNSRSTCARNVFLDSSWTFWWHWYGQFGKGTLQSCAVQPESVRVDGQLYGLNKLPILCINGGFAVHLFRVNKSMGVSTFCATTRSGGGIYLLLMIMMDICSLTCKLDLSIGAGKRRLSETHQKALEMLIVVVPLILLLVGHGCWWYGQGCFGFISTRVQCSIRFSTTDKECFGVNWSVTNEGGLTSLNVAVYHMKSVQ